MSNEAQIAATLATIRRCADLAGVQDSRSVVSWPDSPDCVALIGADAVTGMTLLHLVVALDILGYQLEECDAGATLAVVAMGVPHA